MSDITIGSSNGLNPVTFITNLAELVPVAFDITYYVTLFIALCMLIKCIRDQINTGKGEGNTTFGQNMVYAAFACGLAVLSQYVGTLGKGLYGDFTDGSVLYYATKADGSMARIAMAAFLYVLQFIGALGCIAGWRLWSRVATNRQQQGETYLAAFWYMFGGLFLVFIHHGIGLISGLVGGSLSKFINSL